MRRESEAAWNHYNLAIVKTLPLYVALTVALTWPLAAGIARDVPGDLGDPLFTSWALAWDATHLGRGQFPFLASARPGPLDQGKERRVGPQRDGLEVDVGQGEDDRRGRPVVGDDQRLRLDPGNVIRQGVGRFADLDGLHSRNSSPPIRKRFWSLTPTARMGTTGSGPSSRSLR